MAARRPERRAGPAAGTVPVSVSVDGGSGSAAADAAPRKASDRGASAVEWVVITGIVVAIVAGVGWGISQAISKKADQACNKINNAGSLNASGGTVSTDGDGCAK
ncbi:Flp family type IVb pilin [Catenulispora yoronensis]